MIIERHVHQGTACAAATQSPDDSSSEVLTLARHAAKNVANQRIRQRHCSSDLSKKCYNRGYVGRLASITRVCLCG